MEKKLHDLIVDEELETLIPPMNDLEFSRLTESILANGCEMPLLVWNGTIVDGHNRYRICREYDVPFAIEKKEFEDKDAAKVWIIKNQLGRRNITDYVKCELVVPLDKLLKAEAEKRMLRGKKSEDDPVPNLAQGSGKSRDQLASMAGVSHGTMDKVRKIIEYADDETKDKLRKGKISIHKAYLDIRKAKQTEAAQTGSTSAALDGDSDFLSHPREKNSHREAKNSELDMAANEESFPEDSNITKPLEGEDHSESQPKEDNSTVAEQNVRKLIDDFLMSLSGALDGLDGAGVERVIEMIRAAGKEAENTVENYVVSTAQVP